MLIGQSDFALVARVTSVSLRTPPLEISDLATPLMWVTSDVANNTPDPVSGFTSHYVIAMHQYDTGI
jgi:hypothetical protein